MTDNEYSREKLAMLRFRAIRPGDECLKCNGSGVVLYASTSTWRGGMGGASMTADVCDSCWGSGNRYEPWDNLRALESKYNSDLSAMALTVLEHRIGCGITNCHQSIEAICQLLDDASKPTRRKARPDWFDSTCQALVKVLRDGMAARKALEKKTPGTG